MWNLFKINTKNQDEVINIEQISHIVLMFSLLNLNKNAGWDCAPMKMFFGPPLLDEKESCDFPKYPQNRVFWILQKD